MARTRSDKIIVHLDMNSYFASVEQQANPTLRGRALGVCSYLHEYGCVIAASIEAKRKGMKVGMSVADARKKVPSAVFVENDPAKYRAVTSRVFSILHELTDTIEHYSIDEAFLDLTGWYRDEAEAAWAMTRVRRRITVEVGEWLRCSIGIAPTRFLAKTASDMEKPNGLVIINHANLDEMLSRLDLEDVCGIGPRMRRRLERAGLHTLIEIKRCSVMNLMQLFGKYGYFLHSKLHGIEVEHLTLPDEVLPKSVGHSYCVPLRVSREGKIPAVLMKLTERAGRRMRSLGQSAGTISVMVGFRGSGEAQSIPIGFASPVVQGASDFVHLGEPASDSYTLVGTALDLLHELWQGQPVSFLSVTLSDLSVSTGQARLANMHAGSGCASLWESSSNDRRIRASQMVDKIRDRYGDASIMLGSMMSLEDEAPDRIGFRKTEGIDVAKTF